MPSWCWALFTLLLSLGSSEGNLSQQTSKPHGVNRETKRWLPLSVSIAPGAQNESELVNQWKADQFVDQKLNKKPRDDGPVHKEDIDIFERRHGLLQVPVS